MARKRLTELRFPKEVIADVSKLVELHLRFHGYGDGEWTDSAVRRYVRDAGPLLTRLHALTRADSTTRNARKAARLAATYDALEARIEVLREQEELDKIRPELDGGEIMQILGLAPGPLVGKAWNFLLELRLSEGLVGRERATEELLGWAAGEGIAPPPDSPTA
jgi:poly(A) polymerase